MIQLGQNKALRVRDWTKVYTKGDAKSAKTLKWISIPVGFCSSGLQNLIDDFGMERALMFVGLWEFICKVAARSAIPGCLYGSNGAYSTAAISRLAMGVPIELVDELIEWALSDRANWLEVVSVDAGGICVAPGISGNIPETSRLQDRTLPDKTLHSGRPVRPPDEDEIPVDPIAPATVEWGTPEKETLNKVADAIKKSAGWDVRRKLSEPQRSAIYRCTAWLESAGDRRDALLREVCAGVAEVSSSEGGLRRLDRLLPMVCQRRSGIDREAFFAIWDGLDPCPVLQAN